jgi:hypothetical protein
LKVFFLPFFSGAGAPPAAAGFAMNPQFQSFKVSTFQGHSSETLKLAKH